MATRRGSDVVASRWRGTLKRLARDVVAALHERLNDKPVVVQTDKDKSSDWIPASVFHVAVQERDRLVGLLHRRIQCSREREAALRAEIARLNTRRDRPAIRDSEQTSKGQS